MSGVPRDSEELLDHLDRNDTGDGLPVVPPTAERIDRMLAETPRAPDEVLLEIPTSFAPLTVESLARCAVMAGCRPAYFPVVAAAFDALAEWENLEAIALTTSGYTPALIVNGPIRGELDVNCSTGLFGPGYRANATIGRAVNLAFVMVGEVFPGDGTMATHTHQGRYTFCIGENEEASAWDPLHVDRGLDPEESAVTVVSTQAPRLVGETGEMEPTDEDVLQAFVHGADPRGTIGVEAPAEHVFVLGEDHAGRLGRDYAKDELKAVLHERCRRDGGSLLRSPEDALVVVAGGIGNWSSILQTWPGSENDAVTKPIA